jgi:hypothetical protein
MTRKSMRLESSQLRFGRLQRMVKAILLGASVAKKL